MGPSVDPLIDGMLGKQAVAGALEIWAVDSALGPKTGAEAAKHEWQTLCIWGGPCSSAGGSDSWQIMVQMARVAGAEAQLPKSTRPPIFRRTLNFLITLAHNMDYRFHPEYSMAYANSSSE